MSIRDGGQAFPLPTAYYPNGELLHGGWDGMTLRDYFAAKVMQATINECSRRADYAAFSTGL
jgi:hypothetical protein